MKTNFTRDTFTMNRNTFAAEYSIAKNGDVYVFTTVTDGKTDLPMRLHFGKDHPLYNKVLEAAKGEAVKAEKKPEAAKVEAVKAEKKPEAAKVEAVKAEKKPETAKPEPVKAEKKPEAAKPEPVKAEPAKVVPVKNWRIVFDEGASRTRVIFDGEPTEAQLKAVTEAGFYYSRLMNSYNKKLTNKAKKAAAALAEVLNAL